MASYRYKAKLTDDVQDAKDIIQNLGRSVLENKIDRESVITNLSAAFKKLESALYYIDRE
jgi:hypothetical protein